LIAPPKYKSLSDEALMTAVAEKDQLAFQELYQRYGAAMHRYFYRMLGQHTEKAKDFTQELFVKVYQKSQTFDPKQKCKTWLYAVATNICKNEYRKNNLIINSLDRFPQVNIPDYDSIPKIQEADQFPQALHTALDKLDEEAKSLFVWRYLEGLNIDEIAELLNVPEGTIKSRIFRVRAKLAKSLAAFHPKNKNS